MGDLGEIVDIGGTDGAVLRIADASKARAAKEGNDELVLGLLREAAGINRNTLRTVRQRLKRRGSAIHKQKRWFASHTFELPENDDVMSARTT